MPEKSLTYVPNSITPISKSAVPSSMLPTNNFCKTSEKVQDAIKSKSDAAIMRDNAVFIVFFIIASRRNNGIFKL